MFVRLVFGLLVNCHVGVLYVVLTLVEAPAVIARHEGLTELKVRSVDVWSRTVQGVLVLIVVVDGVE